MSTDNWTGSAGGDWSVGSNWGTGAAPTSSDDAVINNTGSGLGAGVNIYASTAAVAHSLALNSSALGVYGSLTLGAALTLAGSYLDLYGGTVTAQSFVSGGTSGSSNNEIYGYGTINGSLSSGIYTRAHGGVLVLNTSSINTDYGFYVDASSKLEFTGTVTSAYVYFNGQASTLQVDAPTSFHGSVSGFQLSDVIDLRGIVATSVSYSGSTLTVHYGTNGAQTLTYNVSGSVSGDVVTGTSDGAGGTNVSWSAPAETWTGSTGVDWSVGSNWGTGAAPVSSDDAVINNAGSGLGAGVNIYASTAAVAHSLALNSSALGVYGSLTLGAALTLAGSYLDLYGGTVTAQSFVSGGTSGSSNNEIYGYGTINGSLSSGIYTRAHGGVLVLNTSSINTDYGFYVDASSKLEFTGTVTSAYVYFNGQASTLQVDAPTSFHGSVSGFQLSDVIDLRGIVATSVSYSGSTLTVHYGTNGAQTLTYNVSGSVSGDVVTGTSDGAGGTNVSWSAPAETWTGSTGVDWSVGSNWGTGAAPVSSDDAVINNAGSGLGAGVNIYASTAAVAHSLALNSSALGVYGSLTLGAALTLAGSYLDLYGGTVTAQSFVSGGTSGSSNNEIYGYGTINGSLSSGIYTRAHGGVLVLNTSSINTDYGFYVDASSKLEFTGTVTSAYVYFNGQASTLQVDAPTSFHGSVSGFQLSDVIDLRGIVATSVSYSGSTLTVHYGTNGAQTLTYNVSGSVSGDVVTGTSDGAGGTNVLWSAPVAHYPLDDFGGDNLADILWRDSGGNVRLWTENGATIQNDQAVASIPTDWRIAAVADLSGDGKADLIWRDSAGDTRLWMMNGAVAVSDQAIASIPTNWKIEATGDFDGDGKADLLWRSTSGELREWKMAGASAQADVGLGVIPNGWTIQGTGDFDGDGHDDIAWRGPNGEVRVWEMNGTAVKADLGVAVISADWTIAGVGDFGGDGHADLLWRNTGTGDVRIWDMNGNQTTTDRALASGMGADWQVQEIADFNADGRADILWRNVNSGEVHLWTLSPTGIAADTTVATIPNNWTIVSQPHDFFI